MTTTTTSAYRYTDGSEAVVVAPSLFDVRTLRAAYLASVCGTAALTVAFVAFYVLAYKRLDDDDDGPGAAERTARRAGYSRPGRGEEDRTDDSRCPRGCGSSSTCSWTDAGETDDDCSCSGDCTAEDTGSTKSRSGETRPDVS